MEFSSRPIPPPDTRERKLPRTPIWLWTLFFWPFFAITASTTAAEMPAYLRIALKSFNPDVAPGWAYSITTIHDGRQTTERFDPSKPPKEQWSLLGTEGRAPTSDDLEKYFKAKASQMPGATQATFHKADIEPGTHRLIHEDEIRAEFTFSFREQSINTDRMLGHLNLKLTVNKTGPQPYVEKSTLTLSEPYSPVLTVKMRELEVTANFSPPIENRPSLPVQSTSHFEGRIFFFSMQEDLKFSYFDFAVVP